MLITDYTVLKIAVKLYNVTPWQYRPRCAVKNL